MLASVGISDLKVYCVVDLVGLVDFVLDDMLTGPYVGKEGGIVSSCFLPISSYTSAGVGDPLTEALVLGDYTPHKLEEKRKVLTRDYLVYLVFTSIGC